MNEIVRASHEQHLTRLLRENPVIALLGARQVGKTTLAKALMRGRDGEAEYSGDTIVNSPAIILISAFYVYPADPTRLQSCQ